MGRLRERVERQPRSGNSLFLLWLPANIALYVAGLLVLPLFDTEWDTVLVWACYSIPWVVLVAEADDSLTRWRQRREPGKVQPPARGWMWAMLGSVALLLTPLKLNRRVSDGRLFAILGIALLAIALAVAILARIRKGREAALRTQEAADLARKF